MLHLCLLFNLILNGIVYCCLVLSTAAAAASTDYYYLNICRLPLTCYTTRASIYPCFCARPVAVNLANATGENFKFENEKVKIRTKGGCCFVHYSFTLFATKGQQGKRAFGIRLLQALTEKRQGVGVITSE
jgi:hypothetical protein